MNLKDRYEPLHHWVDLSLTWENRNMLSKAITECTTFVPLYNWLRSRKRSKIDCKTVGFFLKISKKIGKAWRKSCTRARQEKKKTTIRGSVSPQARSLCSASFQTFCLTARPYLNIQKYELFCCLGNNKINISLLYHTNSLHKRCFGSGLKRFGLAKEVV